MAIDPFLDGDPSTDDAALEPLACGRDAAVAWERAEAGTAPDLHERDCPHCIAVRADAAGLSSLVHRMAAEDIEPPASVMDRVMGAVMSELRPHDVLLLESPLGPNRLGRPAAAAVLRGVVDRMDGLRARSCRIEQVPERFDADVAITVTARFGVDLASVTARVRQMVMAAGEQALGVPVRRVDIEVVDIWGGRMSDTRLHVGDSAVAGIAAQRAARVPGVVALRADLAQALLGVAGSVLGQDRSRLPTDGVNAVVRDQEVEVSITIATRLGHNCRDLCQTVQREVAAEVVAQTGLTVTVRVTIVDVLLD